MIVHKGGKKHTHWLSQFHSRFFGLESSPLQPQVLDLRSCPQVEQGEGLAEEEEG